MASSAHRNIRSFLSEGTIEANRFVKFGTAAETVVACGANERAIGISQQAATSGQYLEVALPGGGATLKISETVAKGKMITSIAAGIGEVADAAGEWVGAMAYEAGVVDDEIDVMVTGFSAYASDA